MTSGLLRVTKGRLLLEFSYFSQSCTPPIATSVLTPTGAPYRDYYTVYTQTLITLSPVGRCGRPFFQ
eukprot:SAG25_NODE_6680_length_538_cov_8.724374_1_plen_66_part_10